MAASQPETASRPRRAAGAPSAPRSRRRWLWAIPVALALAAAGAFIAVSQFSAGRETPIENVEAALAPIRGVPVNGLVLGRPDAPVTLVEYADLRCPACALFDTEVLPAFIAKHVRTGRVKVQFVPWAILGPQSETAHRALHAVAEQNRAWAFLSLFYANQGPEEADYVTDRFVRRLAEAAGADAARVLERAGAADAYTGRMFEAHQAAQRMGFTGTPSFIIDGPGGRYSLGSGIPDAETLDRAVATAARAAR